MSASSTARRFTLAAAAVLAALLVGFTVRRAGFIPDPSASRSTPGPLVSPVLNPPISHLLHRR
jgi:hypothetical protein